MDALQKTLQKHWGHDDFRPCQRESIEALLAGNDVVTVLATGAGKSLCFQLPALLCEGTALVFSPLIALMKDQCFDCDTRGIPASYVNSHLSDTESAQRLKRFVAGEFKVFYVAPERMRSDPFRRALKDANISFVVADESHCASIFSNSFRPDYKRPLLHRA